ncbi:cation:proton antiporter [Sphingomonas sp.]|uniref:cation:proton antiporter domain-containing protein n=1 Tax=Sphingomonas sp. TaxID=28214 RepID=UPI0025EFD869|nr:cation:proton antiporter [Sphingomonas sp.]
MLGAGFVFVMLFRRFGLGAVLGYLVAGVVIGPHGLGIIGGAESKLDAAELGIALLLFLVGLELNPARLWRLKRDIFGMGLVQVVACGLAVAGIVWLVASVSWGAALALGLPLALSSTAQVLPSLKASGRINTPFGERAFSVLLFQDLSIVPLITIIAAMSRAPADPSVPPGWLMAVYTVGAIAGLVAAGRYVIGPVLRLVGRVGEQELFIVVGLFTVFASAAVMETLHLSTALGAFVAGVMLADSPYRHEIEADIEPFRAILLGLFFIAVGMVLDIGAVLDNPGMVIGMALALVATKTALIFGIGRLFGMATRPAFGLGLLLSQGGEFGFVLFAQAQAALLIEPRAASIFGAVVTLSMATTPFLLMIARRFEHAPTKGVKPEGPADAPDTTAIVIGYGRFGQTVAHMLQSHGISLTLIDLKPSQIERTAEFGAKVYYGDGRRIDLLRIAGAEQARLILFCTDDRELGPKELSPILGAFPQAAVLVRAFDRGHMIKLAPLDLTIAIREVYESAIYMGVEALKSLGVEGGRIEDIEHDYREKDNIRLEAQTVTGDMHVRDDLFSREPAIVRREA